MFYTDNSKETLSPEQFRTPGSAYRAAPFWAWNCRLDDGLIRRQIGVMHEMGFGGFFMHSRTGLSTPYLSDAFMHAVRTSAEEAERLGMRAYLYDEDRWPSGAAGGLVTANKRFRRRYLLWTVRERADAGTLEEAYRGEKPALLAIYSLELNKDGSLRAYHRDEPSAPGRRRYVYLMTDGGSPRYNGEAYLDTLSAEAVGAFLDTTLEAYAREFGERFRSSMPAIFTDEPQFLFKESLPSPESDADIRLPWTPDLPESYRAAYGCDILDTLPELLWELPNGEPSVARYRYHDHLAERFASVFADRYGARCEACGIALTGHLINEDRLGSQAGCPGEVMRAYRGFAIPGVDVLGNELTLSAVKQTVSAARQFGREGAMSELYGATDWDFDFRGYRYQGDWQAALGITLRVPHLFFMSMAGEAKRDYPASIGCQSAWYKEYAAVEDRYARLNTVLTRGKPAVRVGVIHPIESYWLLYGPKSTTARRREAMEKDFADLTSELIGAQIDFDFIAESLLPLLKKEDDPRAVGAMRYQTVVVPELISLRGTTLEFLKRFREAGGRILFIGGAPRYADVLPSAEAACLAASCETVRSLRQLPEALADETQLSLWDEERCAPAAGFASQLREDTDCRWLFIAHTEQEQEIYVNHPKKLVLRIRGSFAPVLYDPDSGDIAALPYCVENGETVIRRTFFANDSLLLRLLPAEKERPELPEDRYGVIGVKTLTGSFPFELSEPNALLLDKAEMSVDGGEYSERGEILDLARGAALALGLSSPSGPVIQPWVKAPAPPAHRITLRFRIRSEIALDAVKLAVEHPENCDIVWNGRCAASAPDGFYTDEAIRTLPLGGLIRGENSLEITMPFGDGTAVEWCYLLGDFGVRVLGSEAVIVPMPEKLAFASVTEQGLPFYGGKLRVDIPFEVPERSDVLLRAGAYIGAALFAETDGNGRKEISAEPHGCLFREVSAGPHVLSLTLLGSRRNAFGAVHYADPNLTWSWPGRWRTEPEKNPDTLSLTPGDEGAGLTFSRDRRCEEYRLRPFGILASPTVRFLKKLTQ